MNKLLKSLAQNKHTIIVLGLCLVNIIAWNGFVSKSKDFFATQFARFATAPAIATTTLTSITNDLPMQDWVMAKVKAAGLDPYHVWSIIQCESRWNPDVVNNHNKDKSYDMGLWQINSVHKELSNACKLDYQCATAWSIAKIKRDGNFCAWACAKNIGLCD